MGEIRTVKTTNKIKKASNKMYRLERDKTMGVTEIYHINGFLLGRH
jgi:hypothetical protein